MELADDVSGGLVGTVGLALLLWTLVGTVNKVEDSLNFVWRVQRGRSMPRRVIEFALLVTIGPLVIATVIAFSKLAIDSVSSSTPFPRPVMGCVTVATAGGPMVTSNANSITRRAMCGHVHPPHEVQAVLDLVDRAHQRPQQQCQARPCRPGRR